jgi:hypothetical protein
MAIILSRPPIHSLTDKDQNLRTAKSIAFQVLSIFILDCKELVSKAVRKSIADQVSARPPLQYHGQIRQEALATWMKEERPLSWGNQATTSAATSATNYRSLATLLTVDPANPGSGLVKSTERWNYIRVAKQMVEQGVKGFVPAYKFGYFRTALELAYPEIKKYSPRPETADQYALAIIARTMEMMKIHFVPWYPPSNRRGEVSRLAHHDHWLFLDHTSSASPLAGTETAGNSSPRTTYTLLADRDAAADPCAPWSIPDSIQDMGPLWNKTTLPTDWSLTHAYLNKLAKNPKTQYVHDTYNYIPQVYDGSNWKHHLSLVLAILVSAILPQVFCSEAGKDSIDILQGEGMVTNAIRKLSWVKTPNSKHKGVTARAPYITMLTTAILALLEEKSPLREHLKANKDSFGLPWTEKHGEYSFI